MNHKHLARYFEKSGDNKLLEGKIIENNFGFMVYDVLGDEFQLLHVYGNGKYWQSLAEEIAKMLNCTKIVIGTYRNPKTLARKYGYKVVKTGYMMEKEI